MLSFIIIDENLSLALHSGQLLRITGFKTNPLSKCSILNLWKLIAALLC